jgi:ABC-2 type transport system ATP-binding protein
VEVDGPAADVLAGVKAMPGVLDARVASENGGRARYQVDSATGHDIRSELARTIVGKGWGLLELQAENMSLEDIFIELTTKEETTTAGAAES